jgi:hypothetical protein
MPGTYPAAPPTLSGDLLSISRLLQSPTQILRRLRTFTDLRFVSDQILTQRFRSSGGAVLYQVSEPIVNTRPVESVAAGSGYPHDVPPTGAAALAAVQKWGQAADLTDEEITRNVYAGAAVDRALRKLVNSVIKQVDTITLAAIASAVTATQAATAAWSATSGTTILRDIELSVAQIIDLNQGYKPDTLLLSTTKYAYLASDQIVVNMRRREATDNPVYTGIIDVIGGLKVVAAPASSLPTNDVWIVDSLQLGGMADEMADAPGYSVGDLAVQTKFIRKDENDAWIGQGRRLTVPVVQELGAATRITGT